MSLTRSKKDNPSFRKERLKIVRIAEDSKQQTLVKRHKSKQRSHTVEAEGSDNRSDTSSEPITPVPQFSSNKNNLPPMPQTDWSIGTTGGEEILVLNGSNLNIERSVGLAVYSETPHSFFYTNPKGCAEEIEVRIHSHSSAAIMPPKTRIQNGKP